MQRKSLAKVMVVLLMMVMAMPVLAWGDGLRIVVNGDKIVFPDAQPYVDSNNRILIPVKTVAEELGATVEWDAKAQKVTIINATNKVILVIGKKEATVNEQTKILDTASIVENSRTYVPIRVISECLGYEVEWDSRAHSVYINTDENSNKNINVYTASDEDVLGFSNGMKDGEVGKVVEYKGFSYTIKEGDKYSPKVWPNTSENITTKDMFMIAFIRDENNSMIACLQTSWEMVGGDFYKQCEELEEMLSQQISKTCVDQIMEYVYKKTSPEAWLDKKEFNDSNYRITVISNPNSLVELSIYEK